MQWMWTPALAAALAAVPLTLAAAPAARADNDFRNGFEDELGRLAAREVGKFARAVFGVHHYAARHAVVQPAPVYAPPPPRYHAPPPAPVYYEPPPPPVRYAPPAPARRHGGIPPGHLPPPGLCRIWYPDRPPGHQPPSGDCDVLQRRYREGWFIYGG